MWGLKRVFAIVFVFVLQFCWQAVVLMNAQAQTRPEEDPKVIIIKTTDPKEGYLTVYTVTQATITLTPGTVPGGKPRTRKADQKGLGNFDRLNPGNYQVKIAHEDYEPYVTEIRIERGKAAALSTDPISKYGTVVLGLGKQAVEGVTIRLNGNTLTPAQFKTENGVIIIPRVPVGKQTLAINKVGYLDWSEQIDVEPGSNLRAPMMERASIMLTVKSLPAAEVHLDTEPTGRITKDGMLVIRNLDPGKYKLRVRLDGYQTQDGRDSYEAPLELTTKERDQVVEAPLVPIPESGEVEAASDANPGKWTPSPPPGWRFETGKPRGIRIADDRVALVKTTSETNQRFNNYYDFRLVLDVSFSNGKGAAWIVRAKDERNYYLFEMTTAGSTTGEKTLNFYICRDGHCGQPKERYPVTASIETPNETVRIILDVAGDRFSHWIETSKEGGTRLVPDFTDKTFAFGGVGLRAINGLDMFVNQFLVIPGKR